MKTTLFSLTLLLAASTGFAAQQNYTPADIAVELLNDVSGDTWAEDGDVQNLEFTKMKCNLDAGTCELQYKLKKYKQEKKLNTCTLSQINGYNNLIEVVKYGFNLSDGIYDQVSACLLKQENI